MFLCFLSCIFLNVQNYVSLHRKVLKNSESELMKTSQLTIVDHKSLDHKVWSLTVIVELNKCVDISERACLITKYMLFTFALKSPHLVRWTLSTQIRAPLRPFLKLKYTTQNRSTRALTHYRPAMPFGNRKKNILEDLFSPRLSV